MSGTGPHRLVLTALVAAVGVAGCGGERSDREKVVDGVRKFAESNGAVVHAVSCHRYGPLTDQHQWTCRVRVDDPNGGPAKVTKGCDVTTGEDASKFRQIGC